jgi:hypothetical protein
VQNADPWAKAGVMFRNDNTAGSAFADVVVTPGNGVSFQWRATAGAAPSFVDATGLNAPLWVKLTRVANTFSAFYSSDGNIWTQLGTAQTITMNTVAQAGLAVTAHNNGLLNTSAFDNVSVTAAPAVSFTLTAPANSTAGSAIPLTLTAYNANGNVAASYTGTIHFTSTDPNATLRADYTFSAADLGTHTFTASLVQAGTKTITATDTLNGNITAGTATVTVAPAALSKFVLSGYPTHATAGTVHHLTVTATDSYGNTITGYRGTVQFASSDPQATLPGNCTFKSGDAGKHTFTVTLKTAGTQSITATDTAPAAINGSKTGIQVTAAAVARLALTAPTSVKAGSAFSVTVTAYDAYGNVATGYRGTVQFTSSDSTATLPANYTFTSRNAGKHVFTKLVLRAKGTQTLTATDLGDGGLAISGLFLECSVRGSVQARTVGSALVGARRRCKAFRIKALRQRRPVGAERRTVHTGAPPVRKCPISVSISVD